MEACIDQRKNKQSNQPMLVIDDNTSQPLLVTYGSGLTESLCCAYREVGDLADITDSDLVSMGFNKIQVKRLRRQVPERAPT